MTIAKGRKLQVDGEVFVWRLSRAGSRYHGTSGPTANFTAQHGSRRSTLTAKLESKHWTDRHKWDDDLQAQHKVAFTPEDVSRAIQAALCRGWKPKEKGRTFELKGVEFTDYRC